jgi:membrane-bound ClpP family serine protease
MLDWIFALFILLAFIMIILAIMYRDIDPYWNFLFIIISTILWFILALLNTEGIQTAYSIYNSTTGNTTMGYATYAPAPLIYLTYFFGLMGVLCMIYMIVTIFDYYYTSQDKKNQRREEEAGED